MFLIGTDDVIRSSLRHQFAAVPLLKLLNVGALLPGVHLPSGGTMYSLGVLGILENYFKRIEFIVNPTSNEKGR